MLKQYEPNVKATIKFLQLLHVNVNAITADETIQGHPDWPSLLSISDSLKKWNVPNGAGQIDTSLIDELPVPFMAHTNEKPNELAIVTQVTDKSIVVFQKNYNKASVETRESFLKKWFGVYLIAEPNESSGEPNYYANKKKELFNKVLPMAVASLLFIFSIILLNKNNATFDLGIYLQYIILLAGTVVTTLLLWYEIDKNNPFLQKVCKGIAKTSCSAILTTKQAKVFKWLSWSEVGFFYFTGSLLTLTFIPNSIYFLAGLNTLALPYTIFSIYFQSRVAKQWCGLCLIVQGLLIAGFINVLFNHYLSTSLQAYTDNIGLSLLLFALSFLAWYTVKPVILSLQEATNTKREYVRTKFNSEIFDTLIKAQKKINLPIENLGIDIGNPTATNTIVKVCNPYCGPCAAAHPKLEALVAQNKNVRVKIIFSVPDDENNLGYKPVAHLMAIAADGNPDKTRHALDEWYLAPKKDYEAFAAKYPLNGELKRQGEKIRAMDNWAKATQIEFTPTLFFNGQQLPSAYSIEDLEYFLYE